MDGGGRRGEELLAHRRHRAGAGARAPPSAGAVPAGDGSGGVTATVVAQPAVTDETAAAPARYGGGPKPSFLSPSRLPLHLLLLALLLAATFPFLHPSGAYSSDDGAYAVQV